MYVKLNGLKMRFEIGVSVEYFFQNVRHKVFIEFAQCIVTVNVLTLTDDNEERYIFSFTSVNVPRTFFYLCVCLGIFVPLENFSDILGCHYCR